jgi:16S rRNA (guanine527-N7)-methyltransferase
MSADPSGLLRAGLEELEVPDRDACLPRLEAYMAELERWNPRFGLVKFEDRAELVVKHVLDSLSAWRAVADLAGGGRVLDVGSGAGLPGIPLATALPGLSFTLLERMTRRASFLKTCCVLLGLSRVEVLACDLSELRGDFDVVTFRAVAPLSRFLGTIGKAGVRWGAVAAYKGRKERAEAELDDVRRLPGTVLRTEIRGLRTPFLDEERCLAVITNGPLLTNGGGRDRLFHEGEPSL